MLKRSPSFRRSAVSSKLRLQALPASARVFRFQMPLREPRLSGSAGKKKEEAWSAGTTEIAGIKT